MCPKKSIECLENHPAQNPQIAVEMKTCSLFTNNVIDRDLVSYMVWQVTEMTLVFPFITSSYHSLIIPAVRIDRDHSSDPLCGSDLAGVDHDEQLHQVVVHLATTALGDYNNDTDN